MKFSFRPTMPGKRLRYALLAATLAAGAGGLAVAQTVATYDPAQLPATKGRVAQYSLTPRGDVDGLILEDGTEVHLPPHLGTQLVAVAKPGDAVTVRGLRAREVPMVQAMQVTNDGSNQSVTDKGPGAPPKDGPRGGPRGDGPRGEGPRAEGPRGPGPRGPGRPDAGQPMEAQGVVKALLHGPRGELNGALLQDGTIIRMPPPEAQRLAAKLIPGQTLFVRGEGSATALGRVIAARAVGADAASAVQLQAPPPRGPDAGPGRDRRGPPDAQRSDAQRSDAQRSDAAGPTVTRPDTTQAVPAPKL